MSITTHNRRAFIGVAAEAGFPQYAEIESRLAAQPTIAAQTITMDGDADGVVPVTDGKSSAAKFTGEREHRVIPSVGHNLPQEDPKSFAAAV